MSVDLMGSTAFKASEQYEHRRQGSHSPDWVKAFRTFYEEFPRILKDSFQAACGTEQLRELLEGNNHPKVWKTVGDEIVFCNRVLNCEHTAVCISSFVRALDEYSGILERNKLPLKVKGAGWLAAFPAPNISIEVFSNGNAPGVTGGESNDYDSKGSDADRENDADSDPHKFDFLGKGIDTGFRIAKNASEDRFIVSVQLGYVLARASTRKCFLNAIGYHGRESLKGVVGGTPYPVISIDTERSELQSKLKSRESALTGHKPVSPFALSDFLETFMQSAGIETPYLFFRGEDSSQSKLPKSYLDYQVGFQAGLESDEKKFSDVRAIDDTNAVDDSALQGSREFLERIVIDSRSHEIGGNESELQEPSVFNEGMSKET